MFTKNSGRTPGWGKLSSLYTPGIVVSFLDSLNNSWQKKKTFSTLHFWQKMFQIWWFCIALIRFGMLSLENLSIWQYTEFSNWSIISTILLIQHIRLVLYYPYSCVDGSNTWRCFSSLVKNCIQKFTRRFHSAINAMLLRLWSNIFSKFYIFFWKLPDVNQKVNSKLTSSISGTLIKYGLLLTQLILWKN